MNHLRRFPAPRKPPFFFTGPHAAGTYTDRMSESTPSSPLSIAVLGIGMMGFPMARRLCEAGHRVTAWNRSRAKAERLLPFGARVADRPDQAVAGADVVVCLLEDGSVVESVLFAQGASGAMRPGALVIDMSSIQPRQARDHAARLAPKTPKPQIF